MQKIKIGIIGLGTIGLSFLKILQKEKELIEKRTNLSIEVVRICDRSWEKKKSIIKDIKASNNPNDILEDTSVHIVVELVGGIEKPRQWLQKALEKNKAVITANKALLASYGNEILGLAKKKGLEVGFEAAVGGAMPVIRNFRKGLVGDNTHIIYGILNGTTNYILSQMARGMDYSQALELAQKKGYAEANPELDVGGTDAAQKLSILAALCFDIPILSDRVKIQGITQIKPTDINFAASLGYRIRPLAVARKSKNDLENTEQIELSVHPAMIPQKHLLASVDDTMNAALIESEYTKKMIFIGPGAGGFPTASSVLSDIVYIAQKNKQTLEIWLTEHKAIPPEADSFCRFYLRLSIWDKLGSLAEIAFVLAEHNISIARIQQYEGEEPIDVVVLTSKVFSNKMHTVQEKLNNLSTVHSLIAIRIEEP